MDSIADLLEQFLATCLESNDSKTNFNNLSDDFEVKIFEFSQKLTEWLTRSKSQIANNVIKVVSSLDLDLVTIQNGNGLHLDELSDAEDVQILFKLNVLKYVLKVCVDNNVAFDDSQLELSRLVDLLLRSYESMSTLVIELFDLIFSLDSSLISHEKISTIIEIAIIDINAEQDTNFWLVHYKNVLLVTILKIATINGKSVQFHQWLLEASAKLFKVEMKFSSDFDGAYSGAIFELHFNQAFNVWRMFLEKCSIDSVAHVDLFCKFLSHIRILESKLDLNRESLIEHIERTEAKFQNINAKNEHYLRIFFAIANMRLLLKNNESIQVPESASECFELANLFPQTTSKQWEKISLKFAKLKDDSKLILLKLLLVQYRYSKLIHSANSYEILTDVVGKITSTNCRQYGLFAFIINELNTEDLSPFVEFIFDDLFDQDSREIKMDQHFLFSTESLWESQHFHSVFMNCYLKKLLSIIAKPKRKLDVEKPADEVYSILSNFTSDEAKWIEFGTLNPNPADESQKKLTKLIRASARLINVHKEFPALEKQKLTMIQQLASFFDQNVQVEYLSPVNQLRAIITYSALSTCINWKVDPEEPMSGTFFRANLRLWNSVRRCWLFDYIPPGQFIYTLLHHMQFDLGQLCHSLFSKFVDNLYRLSDCEISSKNISELVEVLHANEHKVKIEAIMMLQTIVLKANSQFIHKFNDSTKFEPHKDCFEAITQTVSSHIYKNIKADPTKSLEQSESKYMIEGLTSLFEYKVFQNEEQNLHLKNKWRKLLAKYIEIAGENLLSTEINPNLISFLRVVIVHSRKLTDILPENFITDLWSKVIGLHRGEPYKLYKKINSDSFWQKAFTDSSSRQKLNQLLEVKIENPSDADSNDSWVQSVNHTKLMNYLELYHSIQPLIEPIVDSCCEEELGSILQSSTEALMKSDLYRSIFVASIWKAITGTPNINLAKMKILEQNFPLLMSLLINLIFTCHKTPIKDIEEIQLIPFTILQIVKSTITKLIDHNLISNSHLFLVYNICIETNLFHYCDSNLHTTTFNVLFEQINAIISEIIGKRPHLAIFSMCTLLNLINMLLASLMRAANESTLVNTTSLERATVENISKSFGHLLTQLASLDDFKPFALHLIALYLQQSQSASATPPVKSNLSAAIFKLIDLIGEDRETIERFHSRLCPSSRILLKANLELHDKYHRFKGYV